MDNDSTVKVRPEVADLFETIYNVYSRHGFNFFTSWQGWPSLNKFYPSPEALGDHWFICTDQNNFFERFKSPEGDHPVLGLHISGDNAAAFDELSVVLGLELVAEYDDSNWLTYEGKKVRYWKITTR